MADPVPDRVPDFAPRRLTRRSWRLPAGLLAGLVAALVLVATLGKGGPTPAQSGEASASPSAHPPVAVAPAPPVPASGPVTRPMPDTVLCHGLDETRCTAVVRAALALLGAGVPDAVSATAWSSLLCDSTIDCPPADLATAVPLGSVVLTFADGGPSAWVNVVDHPAASGGGPSTDAWIVLWQRASLPVPRPSPSPAQAT